MTPVLCVGESLQDRESGRTVEVVQAQNSGGLINKLGWLALPRAYGLRARLAIGLARQPSRASGRDAFWYFVSSLPGCCEAKAQVVQPGIEEFFYGGSVKPAECGCDF